jgi:cell division protein FtsB
MRRAFILSILLFLVCMPAFSSADVKITLTSGREIIADSCEEEGGRLICTKMGGTFDIEKKDVENIREIGSRGSEPPPGEPASPQPAEPEKKTDGAPGENRQDKEKPPAGGESGTMKRLDDIAQKKKELYSERDKLVKEREQLEADLNKAPDWMPTKQYEELTKRNDQLAEKIKLFNDEAVKLKEEEKQIVEGLKKKKD